MTSLPQTEASAEEDYKENHIVKQLNISPKGGDNNSTIFSTEQLEVEEAIDVLQNLDNWDD